MLARSGLVGKNPPGPIWGHLRPFFPWAGRLKKMLKELPIFLGGPMGPIHPVWALAAIHPRWGNRYAATTTDDQLMVLLHRSRVCHSARRLMLHPEQDSEVDKSCLHNVGYLLPHSSKGPNQVNRAHWPTKEN